MRVTVERQIVHRCPYRDDIDIGTIRASWDGAAIELHALAAFIDTFAAVKVTHEAVTDRIADRIALEAHNVDVVTTWQTAGMTVEVRSEIHADAHGPPAVIYLTGASNAETRALARVRTDLGLMIQPRCPYTDQILDYPVFAADNGCFNAKWEPASWLRFLDRVAMWQERCLFAVVPDVYADHKATLDLWPRWAGEVVDRGLPAAFVAQNGCTPDDVPDCDALFIGGDTEWKLSRWAWANVAAARARGRWAHVGRVNTAVRWGSVRIFGADSADGTLVKHGPRPAMMAQLEAMLDHPPQLEFAP